MQGDEEDEREIASACADCGELIPSGIRSYEFGEQSQLCWSCAIRRGGSYDAKHERWTTNPSTDNLRIRMRDEET